VITVDSFSPVPENRKRVLTVAAKPFDRQIITNSRNSKTEKELGMIIQRKNKSVGSPAPFSFGGESISQTLYS